LSLEIPEKIIVLTQYFYFSWKDEVAIGRTDIEDLDLYATSRERRFRLFASIECEGQLFMTPYDFILAVTTDEPKVAKTWKSLSKQELNQMLAETPPVWKGSSKLFRNLKERGVISYTEYLFLLCILTSKYTYYIYFWMQLYFLNRILESKS
ncbi:MICU3 isoform 4, partial [Pongo abelii]